jgi:nucleoside-diphosphate-sugar epimerase
MRLLVLGGTLFLSREVAAEAVRRGHAVTCACRGSAPVPDGATHVPLDRGADDVATVLRADAAGWDAVVEVGRRPTWVRAAVAAVPGAHWVFVSSISVYADHGTPDGGPGRTPLLAPVPEDRDLETEPEAYGGMKVACEQAVQAGAASSTVVRPGLIVGPGDPTGRFTYWVERLADDGTVLAPGSPSDPTQVVDVRDLAAWLVTCAEQRVPGVLDAIGPVVPRASLLEQVATGVGASPRLRWVPSERLVALDVAEWAGPRSLPLWLAAPEYAGMLAHDPEPAAAAGLRHRPLEQTAADTLAWVRAARDATRTGLTRAEEAEVLAQVEV